MNKKTIKSQGDSKLIFSDTDEAGRIALLISMRIEDPDPEDLCFCGEPINMFGYGLEIIETYSEAI